jgi:hypothetical protein
MNLDKEGLASLLERVRDCDEADNALDIEIEIATFQPDRLYSAVRPNAAGTKLIYTTQDGGQETCWAWDWTLNEANRKQAADAIRALINKDSSHG